MLSMFFHTLYNLVDAYWVSKLSADAIAAVSISQIALFIMISLGFGITVGSGVVMGMKIGAKNIPEAERVLGQSFVLSALAGVIFTVLALVFRNPLLVASGATGDIFAPAMAYFTITAAGASLFFLLITIMFSFNAQGDTFTLTKLFALSTGINLVLDPILIFGYFGFPELGIQGAAIATLISQAVFIGIALFSLSRPDRTVQFHFRNLSFRWESVKQVLNIGIPAALTQVIFPLGLAGLTYIVALGFEEAGAIAFSLGFRVEFFAFLPAAGFGFGAMAIMGQSIGAKKMERAREAFSKAFLYSFLADTGIGVAVALFAGAVIGVFTQDPVVMEYARSYMWTVALTYGFLGGMMVEASAFQSINKSWHGFWIFVLRFLVISIPLSYVLTQIYDFSIQGVWVAIMLGNIVATTVGYFWIRRTMNTLSPRATA